MGPLPNIGLAILCDKSQTFVRALFLDGAAAKADVSRSGIKLWLASTSKLFATCGLRHLIWSKGCQNQLDIGRYVSNVKEVW